MFIMMKKVVGQFISIKINLEIFKTALISCLFCLIFGYSILVIIEKKYCLCYHKLLVGDKF